jgi:hypothetical protein
MAQIMEKICAIVISPRLEQLVYSTKKSPSTHKGKEKRHGRNGRVFSLLNTWSLRFIDRQL